MSMEERTYRVELVINGKPRTFGYYSETLDFIIRCMEGRLKGSPIVNIYSKYGKRVLMSFQGGRRDK